jgi:hypothetical protein
MKRILVVYALSFVFLTLGIMAIRVTQAQFDAPAKKEIAGMSNMAKIGYWTSVLADPGQAASHAAALEQIEIPARLLGNIAVLEDLAQAYLQSPTPEIAIQAQLLWGDVLLENDQRNEAKTIFLKASLFGSAKAARHYA